MSDLGRTLIFFGIILVIAGAVLLLGPRIPWLGRLPGDIVYRSDRVTFYFPIVTCIVLSIVLSVLLWLWRR
ncbi:DUF2905 domain-containing protein [Candidatus Binatia bacterium]|nr:DUF2905 domain-containing protein [Candidatus Binatia bacterium]